MFEPNLTINSFFPTNLCKKGLHPRGRAGWHCLSFPFYRGERRGGATRWERGRWEPSRPGWGVAAPAVVSALCTSAPAVGGLPAQWAPGLQKVARRTPRGSGGARRAQRRRRDPGPRAARRRPPIFLCCFFVVSGKRFFLLRSLTASYKVHSGGNLENRPFYQGDCWTLILSPNGLDFSFKSRSFLEGNSI